MRTHVDVFDKPLLVMLILLLSVSMITMWSSAHDFPGRLHGHARNFLVATVVMWATALCTPRTLMRLALPIYVLGVALLVGVEIFGVTKNGATRWLDVGLGQIQPSEIMKIGLPLLLAWYFHQREASLRWHDFMVAAVLLILPTALILKQPDLGTALLVLFSGSVVIFLAGLSWKVWAGLIVSAFASLPLVWTLMHDYQRQRVLTLLDPTSDPLGKGFHIIQSMIAIGSGGPLGKGWMQGTQTHLEFIPERTTDFIFSVYSEEFGFLGNVMLVALYGALIARGLVIAANAGTLFGRLLAGSVAMIFFIYAFVNMGMVSGILPVVGVPLPFMSYGGTAMVTLAIGAGILMTVQRHRHLVQG